MIQTAAEIGHELTQFVQQSRWTEEENTQICMFVDRLLATPGLTAVDALAFVALADSLLREFEHAAAEAPPETVARLHRTIRALVRRAIEALELVTEMARDGFDGTTRNVN